MLQSHITPFGSYLPEYRPVKKILLPERCLLSLRRFTSFSLHKIISMEASRVPKGAQEVQMLLCLSVLQCHYALNHQRTPQGPPFGAKALVVLVLF